jgi:hypothetical protein
MEPDYSGSSSQRSHGITPGRSLAVGQRQLGLTALSHVLQPSDNFALNLVFLAAEAATLRPKGRGHAQHAARSDLHGTALGEQMNNPAQRDAGFSVPRG